jgi:Tol biopolymer transport system component
MSRQMLFGILALAIPVCVGCGPESGRSALVRTLDAQTRSDEATPQPEARDTVPVVRRLWTLDEPDFYASTPSPDGRYVTEIDWWTGDLAVFDLNDGESSVFSPDGQRIAYTWWNEDNEGYEVRIVGLDGSAEWVVLPHPEHAHFGDDAADEDLEYVMVKDWSSDGEHLLALLWYGNRAGGVTQQTVKLGMISTQDGSVRVLKEMDWRSPQMAVFSPDDRYVAFDFPPDKESRDRDIFVLALDGGRESELLAGPGDDRLMGWAPDGSGILFYSDRELTQGIWYLPVSQGRAAGEPRLLKADVWGLDPLGFSRDAYYYGVTLEQPQIHTASVDFASGRFVAPPAPVEDPSEGRSESAAWSPDGRYLAYIHRRNGERTSQLVIRTVAGDDKREIPLTLYRTDHIQWTADGQALMLQAREKGRLGFYRLDMTSGNAVRLGGEEEIEGNIRGGAFSADGKVIYFTRQVEKGLHHMVRMDLQSRSETVVASIPGDFFRIPSVSPDGRTIAVSAMSFGEKGGRIFLVPVTGGEAVELYRTPADADIEYLGNLSWSPDGHFILFVTPAEEEQDDGLWRIAATGGEPERVLTSKILLHLGGPPKLHPDGRRLAFRSGQLKGEIWVMENVPGTGSRIQASRGDR